MSLFSPPAVLLTLVLASAVAAEFPETLDWRAHDGGVTAVALSPDGQWIVSGGDDETLKIWDAASGRERRKVSLASPVTALAIHPDGKIAAVGCWDGKVQLVNLSQDERPQTIAAHEESITSVAFSSDGKQLVTGSGDDTLAIWDVADRKLLRRIKGGSDYDVTCVAFSPNGRQVLSGDGENNLTLWDVAKGKAVLQLGGHGETISCCLFLSENKFLSGSWDDKLIIWDAVNGTELVSYEQHTGDIIAVAASGDGQRVVSIAEDQTLQVWNPNTGKVSQTIKTGDVRCLALSADGKTVVTGGAKSLQRRRLP